MKKILVIKVSSMGDIVHAFPALYDAKKKMSDLECHWVVEESFQDITRLNKDIDLCIKVAMRRWKNNIVDNYRKGEYGDFLRRLKKENYDYIIDPQGLLKSSILALIAKGPSYGFDMKSIREPLASVFYNNKIKVSKSLHAITRIRKLFAHALNYELPDDEPCYNLTTEQLKLNFIVPSEYVIFLHGTSRSNKCWDEKKWVELSNIFAKDNIPVLIFYSNLEEYQRTSRIVSRSSNMTCVPKCSLWEIACLIRNANGLVGLDTGLTHLAAAYDMPMVSLYGPTNIELIGTLGNNQLHKDLYTVTPDEVYITLNSLMNNKSD